MLIRGALLFLSGRFVAGLEVRLHNGQVREIGEHLDSSLYELVVQAEGDRVIPGFVDLWKRQGGTAALFRAGTALYRPQEREPIDDADRLMSGCVSLREALPRLIRELKLPPEEAVLRCTAFPADQLGGRTAAGRIVPGAPLPLTRWSTDWSWKGILVSGDMRAARQM